MSENIPLFALRDFTDINEMQYFLPKIIDRDPFTTILDNHYCWEPLMNVFIKDCIFMMNPLDNGDRLFWAFHYLWMFCVRYGVCPHKLVEKATKYAIKHDIPYNDNMMNFLFNDKRNKMVDRIEPTVADAHRKNIIPMDMIDILCGRTNSCKPFEHAVRLELEVKRLTYSVDIYAELYKILRRYTSKDDLKFFNIAIAYKYHRKGEPIPDICADEIAEHIDHFFSDGRTIHSQVWIVNNIETLTNTQVDILDFLDNHQSVPGKITDYPECKIIIPRQPTSYGTTLGYTLTQRDYMLLSPLRQ